MNARFSLTPPDPDEVIGRSCCCPASPVARVLLPPTRERPLYTGLLLCGHHLRASRPALDARHAIIVELDQVPDDIAAAFRVPMPARRAG